MKIAASVSIICFLLTGQAHAEPWNLPQTLSPANTHVSFEVDSTWHTVHGDVRQIEGRVWLEDPKDFHSIRATIHFPIAGFDTDSERRDTKMRKVMHADAAPAVDFELRDAGSGLCAPQSITESAPCRFEMTGKLSMSKVERDIVVTTQVERDGPAYRIRGAADLKWADYNIEDPSILIASLDETVKIEFLVTLPQQG